MYCPWEERPRGPRMCIWIYGKPGVGKSRWAFDSFDDMYVKDITHDWWDDYKG